MDEDGRAVDEDGLDAFDVAAAPLIEAAAARLREHANSTAQEKLDQVWAHFGPAAAELCSTSNEAPIKRRDVFGTRGLEICVGIVPTRRLKGLDTWRAVRRFCADVDRDALHPQIVAAPGGKQTSFCLRDA